MSSEGDASLAPCLGWQRSTGTALDPVPCCQPPPVSGAWSRPEQSGSAVPHQGPGVKWCPAAPPAQALWRDASLSARPHFEYPAVGQDKRASPPRRLPPGLAGVPILANPSLRPSHRHRGIAACWCRPNPERLLAEGRNARRSDETARPHRIRSDVPNRTERNPRQGEMIPCRRWLSWSSRSRFLPEARAELSKLLTNSLLPGGIIPST